MQTLRQDLRSAVRMLTKNPLFSIVVIVTLAFVLGLRLLNPDYVEPYGTPTGQMVLLVVIGLFTAGFWWLRRLSTFDLPQRFLVASGRSPS